ncbi:MAG: hypothetical protein V1859_02965 [archaeon]
MKNDFDVELELLGDFLHISNHDRISALYNDGIIRLKKRGRHVNVGISLDRIVDDDLRRRISQSSGGFFELNDEVKAAIYDSAPQQNLELVIEHQNDGSRGIMHVRESDASIAGEVYSTLASRGFVNGEMPVVDYDNKIITVGEDTYKYRTNRFGTRRKVTVEKIGTECDANISIGYSFAFEISKEHIHNFRKSSSPGGYIFSHRSTDFNSYAPNEFSSNGFIPAKIGSLFTKVDYELLRKLHRALPEYFHELYAMFFKHMAVNFVYPLATYFIFTQGEVNGSQGTSAPVWSLLLPFIQPLGSIWKERTAHERLQRDVYALHPVHKVRSSIAADISHICDVLKPFTHLEELISYQERTLHTQERKEIEGYAFSGESAQTKFNRIRAYLTIRDISVNPEIEAAVANLASLPYTGDLESILNGARQRIACRLKQLSGVLEDPVFRNISTLFLESIFHKHTKYESWSHIQSDIELQIAETIRVRSEHDSVVHHSTYIDQARICCERITQTIKEDLVNIIALTVTGFAALHYNIPPWVYVPIMATSFWWNTTGTQDRMIYDAAMRDPLSQLFDGDAQIGTNAAFAGLNEFRALLNSYAYTGALSGGLLYTAAFALNEIFKVPDAINYLLLGIPIILGLQYYNHRRVYSNMAENYEKMISSRQ